MVEQDMRKYFESVSNELISTKDRVRNIIGSRHWGEDGRFKEAIVKNVISRFLPPTYSIGTGFVINANKEVSSQIDIIIYDSSSPALFSEGDFVIALAHTVRGIIEVKTKISSAEELKKIIIKCEDNGKVIYSALTDSRKLFNGVFSYECLLEYETLRASLEQYYFSRGISDLRKVNNVSLGPDKFLHFWQDRPRKIEGYELKNLSFAYFISNLLTTIDTNQVEYEHHPLFFPLESKGPHIKFQVQKPNSER